MKKLFTFAISLCIATALSAQTNIKLEDVSKHIGDSVIVCGKVAGMRYFENSKNKPTLLNIGAKHPDQLLTVVIWEDVRSLFTEKPEGLQDKEICITGRISLYKEKVQIVIAKPEQIVVQ
jgi:micrococcal nuclease